MDIKQVLEEIKHIKSNKYGYTLSYEQLNCLVSEIDQLKKHLPDNCAAGICGDESQITAGDAIAMALNEMTKKWPEALTQDEHYDLAIILGGYVDRAISGATYFRQASIEILEAKNKSWMSTVKMLTDKCNQLRKVLKRADSALVTGDSWPHIREIKEEIAEVLANNPVEKKKQIPFSKDSYPQGRM